MLNVLSADELADLVRELRAEGKSGATGAITQRLHQKVPDPDEKPPNRVDSRGGAARARKDDRYEYYVR